MKYCCLTKCRHSDLVSLWRDVNGDGLDDVYAGGANGQAASLMLQGADGTFAEQDGPWKAHRSSEDIAAHFFDADGDGDQDLYVASGGNEAGQGAAYLQRPDVHQHGQWKLYKRSLTYPGYNREHWHSHIRRLRPRW